MRTASSVAHVSDLTPQERLKWVELHEKHGVTQADIAKRFGVTRNLVKSLFRQMREEKVDEA